MKYRFAFRAAAVGALVLSSTMVGCSGDDTTGATGDDGSPYVPYEAGSGSSTGSSSGSSGKDSSTGQDSSADTGGDSTLPDATGETGSTEASPDTSTGDSTVTDGGGDASKGDAGEAGPVEAAADTGAGDAEAGPTDGGSEAASDAAAEGGDAGEAGLGEAGAGPMCHTADGGVTLCYGNEHCCVDAVTYASACALSCPSGTNALDCVGSTNNAQAYNQCGPQMTCCGSLTLTGAGTPPACAASAISASCQATCANSPPTGTTSCEGGTYTPQLCTATSDCADAAVNTACCRIGPSAVFWCANPLSPRAFPDGGAVCLP